MLNENIYGIRKRLEFIKQYISKKDKILEFGCGTGYMITYQLLQEGYNIKGCDIDKKSIDLVEMILKESGLDKNGLINIDIFSINEKFDVIIASEVFEYI